MNFAIWTAVSTQAQATPEKASLEEQEKKCRHIAQSKGWQETAGPYIVRGKSRTKYVDLTAATFEIPELRQMLQDAKEGRFDILLLYDYNRLRDLANPTAKTLAAYGVQMYSISQPVEPLSVEEFTPYASDSEFMMRGMSNIVQRWQIADLRRKFQAGKAKRLEMGLPVHRIPYGYKYPPGKTDSKTVSLIDPPAARVLTQIKDDYLAGKTLREIADTANASKARGKPFHPSTIRRVVANPFYAGKVFTGRYEYSFDPQTNDKTCIIKDDGFTVLEGKHEALWDWETHLLIIDEKKRRRKRARRKNKPFTGLIRCTVCNRRPWYRLRYIRCVYQNGQTDHLALPIEKANKIIPEAIVKALRTVDLQDEAKTTNIKTDAHAMETIHKKRARVQEGYEDGLYTAIEAKKRLDELNRQIEHIQTEQNNIAKKDAIRQRFLSTAEEMQQILDVLPEWIQQENPKEVNRVLRLLIDEIYITPQHEIEIKFRQ